MNTLNLPPPPARVLRPSLLPLAGLLLAAAALSFPPAPHHLVYGSVRDAMGTPLNSAGAEVLLEAAGRVVARSTIDPGLEPGVNYRLAIPMDSGVTADLYKPGALRPTVPFRMRVRVGNLTYLPIEMTGADNLLTRPGERSRVDLTLGLDSDGDGLPDAWEWALIQMLGGNLTLADINPHDDLDGDGLTNLEEYLAGTYAFDPADGFSLAIAPGPAGRPVVEFTAIRGRSYTLFASHDMQHWTAISFSLPADAPGTPARGFLYAAQTRLIRAQVAPTDPAGVQWRFFKVQVR